MPTTRHVWKHRLFAPLLVLPFLGNVLLVHAQTCGGFAQEGRNETILVTVDKDPPYTWALYKHDESTPYMEISCTPTGCTSNYTSDGMSVIATVSLSTLSSTSTTTLYFNNLARGPWNVEGVWKLEYGDEVYKECPLSVFAKAASPKCEAKLLENKEVTVICRTDKVYPNTTACRFTSMVDQKENTTQVVDNDMISYDIKGYGDPVYYKMTCTLTTTLPTPPPSRSLSFKVTMYDFKNPRGLYHGSDSAYSTIKIESPSPETTQKPPTDNNDEFDVIVGLELSQEAELAIVVGVTVGGIAITITITVCCCRRKGHCKTCCCKRR